MLSPSQYFLNNWNRVKFSAVAGADVYQIRNSMSNGKNEVKGAALVGAVTFDPDAAAVQLNEVPGEG